MMHHIVIMLYRITDGKATKKRGGVCWLSRPAEFWSLDRYTPYSNVYAASNDLEFPRLMH